MSLEKRAERERPEQRGARARHQPKLLDLARTVAMGRRTVVLVSAAVLGLALVYVTAAQPLYESTATIRVEEATGAGAVLEARERSSGEKTSVDTEIEMIRSRRVLQSVVEQLALQMEATPRRYPVLGSILAQRYSGLEPAPAPFGSPAYAWGGESIRIERLATGALGDRPLTLTALENGRFELGGPDGTRFAAGQVGDLVRARVGSTDVEIRVASLVARPGTQFVLRARDPADVAEKLQRSLFVHERGKKTGVLTLSLQGPDPAATASILNAIAERYVAQDIESRSGELNRTVAFLEGQLPDLRARVAAAELKLKALKVSHESLGLADDARRSIESSVAVERELTVAQLQRVELANKYTPQHHAILAVDQKIAALKEKKAATEARIRELPETELESARAVRDLKVSSELYLALLSKAQEFRMLRAALVPKAVVVDRARVAKRPARRPSIVLAIAFVLGPAAGAALVLIRRALSGNVDDPDEVEQATGIPVYGIVPHTKAQGDRNRGAGVPLSASQPEDLAVESLRALAASVEFELATARPRIVAVASPAPLTGKSFVSANMATLLAAAGHKVLLVDADLRRGTLHRDFGLARGPGLSDVLERGIAPGAVVKRVGSLPLAVVPSGAPSSAPATLLGSKRYDDFLSAAAAIYDYVIVDTAPVLAVADGALAARGATRTVLVLRAGRHTVDEIHLAVKQLVRNGVDVWSAVLNDVRTIDGRYGKFGRYGAYRYFPIADRVPSAQGAERRASPGARAPGNSDEVRPARRAWRWAVALVLGCAAALAAVVWIPSLWSGAGDPAVHDGAAEGQALRSSPLGPEEAPSQRTSAAGTEAPPARPAAAGPSAAQERPTTPDPAVSATADVPTPAAEVSAARPRAHAASVQPEASARASRPKRAPRTEQHLAVKWDDGAAAVVRSKPKSAVR